MDDLYIEKGIPLPDKSPPGGSKRLWHGAHAKWKDMEVGDSILVSDFYNAQNLTSSIRRYSKYKSTIRRMEGGAYRVWRIA